MNFAKILSVFMFGFSSGLPLLLTGSTLQAWMTEEKVDLKVIGLFALVGLPYTLKFLWSPLLDRYVLPFLGRRRGWILVFQLGLAISIGAMGMVAPAQNPWLLALACLVVTFFSASQDIVIDAWRREALTDHELGLGSGLYVNGYRIGMLVAGALALLLATVVSWPMVFFIMGLVMLAQTLVTFLSPEPETGVAAPKTLKEAVVEPFVEFFRRDGALLVLAFILLYKVGDNMAASMTMPMYLKLGYQKTEIAAIAKGLGLIATLGGGLLGGVMMLKMSMGKALWFFGILQAVSTVAFSALASSPPGFAILASVITFENLTAGMGTSAYAAFMASVTNRRFTATQYALLSSLMGVPRVIIGSSTGVLADSMGFPIYFLFCTLIAIPGLLLISKVTKLLNASQNNAG